MALRRGVAAQGAAPFDRDAARPAGACAPRSGAAPTAAGDEPGRDARRPTRHANRLDCSASAPRCSSRMHAGGATARGPGPRAPPHARDSRPPRAGVDLRHRGIDRAGARRGAASRRSRRRRSTPTDACISRRQGGSSSRSTPKPAPRLWRTDLKVDRGAELRRLRQPRRHRGRRSPLRRHAGRAARLSRPRRRRGVRRLRRRRPRCRSTRACGAGRIGRARDACQLPAGGLSRPGRRRVPRSPTTAAPTWRRARSAGSTPRPARCAGHSIRCRPIPPPAPPTPGRASAVDEHGLVFLPTGSASPRLLRRPASGRQPLRQRGRGAAGRDR